MNVRAELADRKGFEAWAESAIGQFSPAGYHGTLGRWHYHHNIVQLAWECWLAALEQGEADRAEIQRLRTRQQKDSDYIKKMDGIIEEVGGVTASCINPYEDLKRALQGQKQRAEAAEAQLAAIRAREGDSND